MNKKTDKLKKYDSFDRQAQWVMIRALVHSHPDLAWLLECFDVEAEKISACSLATRRSDEDIDIEQLALVCTREMIREAAVARKTSSTG